VVQTCLRNHGRNAERKDKLHSQYGLGSIERARGTSDDWDLIYRQVHGCFESLLRVRAVVIVDGECVVIVLHTSLHTQSQHTILCMLLGDC